MASKLEELQPTQTGYIEFEFLRVQNVRLKYRFWLLVIFLAFGFFAFVTIVAGVVPPLIMYCHHHNNSNDVSSPELTNTYTADFFHCVGMNSTECETDCRCGWCTFSYSRVETSVCLSMDYKQHCQALPLGKFISDGPCGDN